MSLLYMTGLDIALSYKLTYIVHLGFCQSICADAQSDLGLRCLYMPEDTFSSIWYSFYVSSENMV